MGKKKVVLRFEKRIKKRDIYHIGRSKNISKKLSEWCILTGGSYKLTLIGPDISEPTIKTVSNLNKNEFEKKKKQMSKRIKPLFCQYKNEEYHENFIIKKRAEKTKRKKKNMSTEKIFFNDDNSDDDDDDDDDKVVVKKDAVKDKNIEKETFILSEDLIFEINSSIFQKDFHTNWENRFVNILN